jgi:hypothetical protein
MPSPEKRFWLRVNKDGDCWLWTGGRGSDGYGKFYVAPKTVRVHRFSYQLHLGPIPEGMLVCHMCDTPLCVNPAHLFVGTPADNTRDMVEKGRVTRWAAFKTHCAQGHEFTPENTYKAPSVKQRVCKTCLYSRGKRWDKAHPENKRERMRRWQARRKAKRAAA